MLSLMAETKRRSDGDLLGAMIVKKYGNRGQVTFAKHADVSTPTVSVWVGTPKFKPAMWRSVREALEANGMDPSEIRETPIVFSREKADSNTEELHPTVNEWSADNLRTLRRILKASEQSRTRLLYWIEGRITR